MHHYLFHDRKEAGQQLVKTLASYAGKKDVLVLALPRGGVPVAFEVASALSVPLDLCIVRKLGVPGHEEFAMGAIASGGIRYLNREIIDNLSITPQAIEQVVAKEQAELTRRDKLYRSNKPSPQIKDKTVIVVDDGLATGATMRAAIAALRQQRASKIVVAVPVGSISTCIELEKVADQVFCMHTPEPFYGVGQWYRDFSQTTDEEVRSLLQRSFNDNDVELDS